MTDDSGIADALGSERGRQYLEAFLAETGANVREGAQRLRANTGRMVLVALLFEIVNRGGVADFALGPVRLREPALVQLALPVIVAFLLRELMLGLVQLRRSTKAHHAGWRVVDRRLVEGPGRLALGPPTVQLWGHLGRYSTDERSPAARIASGIDGAVFLAVFVGTVAFEYYACIQLLDAFDDVVLLPLLASFLTLVLVVHGLSVVYLDMRDDD